MTIIHDHLIRLENTINCVFYLFIFLRIAVSLVGTIRTLIGFFFSYIEKARQSNRFRTRGIISIQERELSSHISISKSNIWRQNFFFAQALLDDPIRRDAICAHSNNNLIPQHYRGKKVSDVHKMSLSIQRKEFLSLAFFIAIVLRKCVWATPIPNEKHATTRWHPLAAMLPRRRPSSHLVRTFSPWPKNH
jgi:hypothetical protein